jgi:hypothetical protein
LKQTVAELERCAKYHKAIVIKCHRLIRLILIGRYEEPILFLKSIEGMMASQYLRIPRWILPEESKEVASLHDTVNRLEKLIQNHTSR